MKRYRIGDTITVEVELRDQSGIGMVQGIFSKTDGGGGFAVNGDGAGQTSAKVAISWAVTNAVVPGEYILTNILAFDSAGNRLDTSTQELGLPEIRISIEADDKNPPEIVGVNLA